MTIQMTDIEQYFHAALFIILYKVALTVQSVDENPQAKVKWKL